MKSEPSFCSKSELKNNQATVPASHMSLHPTETLSCLKPQLNATASQTRTGSEPLHRKTGELSTKSPPSSVMRSGSDLLQKLRPSTLLRPLALVRTDTTSKDTTQRLVRPPTGLLTRRKCTYKHHCCSGTHLMRQIEVRVHFDHLPAAIAILINPYEEAGVVFLSPVNVKVRCL